MPGIRKTVIARNEYAMSLEEVAATLGVTQQAVQQTEKSALRKCRRLLANRGLSIRDFFAAMPIGHHDMKRQRRPHGKGTE
jgi:DNA-directed RNA polymerase sigma subunit (sigma70/sigma32)